MRFLFIAILPFLFSCNSNKIKEEKAVSYAINEDTLHKSMLSADDIFILEVHYPSVLKKIATLSSLNVKDVLTLHQIGVHGDVLIHIIKYTNSNYMLTADDVVSMQLEGVPFEVINFMIES